MKIIFLTFGLFVVFVSCTDEFIGEQIDENTRIDSFFAVTPLDTVKIDLGYFGDEEGAWLFHDPQHARFSNFIRTIYNSKVFYEYAPELTFTGNDTVGIILNRGSDGASPGVNDSVWYCIVVE